jgi:hypothetical protein
MLMPSGRLLSQGTERRWDLSAGSATDEGGDDVRGVPVEGLAVDSPSDEGPAAS